MATVMADRSGGDLVEARAARQEHRDLLRARAAALARVPRGERRAAAFTAVVFTLGDERYALALAPVLQVAVLRELTPLPGAAEPILGVTEWRGDVLTVLDLRPVVGAAVQGVTDLGRIIVLDGPGRTFGILAHRVSDMVEVHAERLKPLPREPGQERSLLRGMTDDGMLVMDDNLLLERYGTVASVRTRGRGG